MQKPPRLRHNPGMLRHISVGKLSRIACLAGILALASCSHASKRPPELAEAAKKIGQAHHQQVTILGPKELEREGMKALLAVSQGSIQEPRLIVIEQPAELKIAHPNGVRWEAVAEIPGQVAVTPSQLVAAALRHRPDRIIMGEIRDECGYDLLQAMNTGHGGTLSTLHADSALDALDRLADMALSARTNLDQQFIRSQTGKAVDFVLYCERDSSGRRRVRELITVSGYSHADQCFVTEEIYRASSTAAA